LATNTIYNIEQGLKTLFAAAKISAVSEDQTPRSREFVRISLSEMPFTIENNGASHSDSYSFNLDFYTNRNLKSREFFQALHNISEVLEDNVAYSPAGVYKWHDGTIEANELPTDEEYAARINWAVTVTEAI